MISYPIVFREHCPLHIGEQDKADLIAYLRDNRCAFHGEPDDFMGIPKKLGICRSSSGDTFQDADQDLTASYYIGADWLDGELETPSKPFIVLPKVDNVDFVSMFAIALSSKGDHARYFSRCYGIEYDKPFIESRELDAVLSPLLIFHFIGLLKQLVRHDLKRGYKIIDENLNGRVKGRILLDEHLRNNILGKREERCFCQYQEYTVDIPENRLLKKALVFSKRILNTIESIREHSELKSISIEIKRLLDHFEGVSDEIDLSEIRSCGKNKLFAQYHEAIRIAKDILRRYEYAIDNVGEQRKNVPVFWIDMPRLFELYILNILEQAYPDEVAFQVPGHYRTKADFIRKGTGTNERYILDAKYKPRYTNGNAGILEDIREISGYAYDGMIVSALGLPEGEKPKCIIIYPEPFILEDEEGTVNDTYEEVNVNLLREHNIENIATPIRAFPNFFKICVKLPTWPI